MEIVIIIAMVCFLIATLLASQDNKPLDNIINGKLVIEKKKCPPHQWEWQEVVDQTGVKQGERIVCKVCGPLNFQPGREE